MTFTKEEARKYVEWFSETLKGQPTAQPCVYFYNGKIGFSPGSQIGGTAQPVHDGEAEILVDKETWTNWFDLDDEDKADLIFEEVNAFLKGD